MRIVKQYGEMRTGTNIVRSCLAEHFEEVLVLMHLLGDKHSPPAPFMSLWKQVLEGALERYDFALRATECRPAESTRLDEPGQAAYVEQWASAIAEAFHERSIQFLVSIKSPLAWLASLRKYESTMLGRTLTPTEVVVDRYARCYKAWLGLRDIDRFDLVIVRHEDLIDDVNGCMRRVADQLHIRPKHNRSIELPEEPVNPCFWDHIETTTATGTRFNHDYYRDGAYRNSITTDDRRIVCDRLDWAVLAEYGYSRTSVL